MKIPAKNHQIISSNGCPKNMIPESLSKYQSFSTTPGEINSSIQYDGKETITSKIPLNRESIIKSFLFNQIINVGIPNTINDTQNECNPKIK